MWTNGGSTRAMRGDRQAGMGRRPLRPLAKIDKGFMPGQIREMTKTVNISLPPGQRAWLENRRDTGGYTSTSDVVQDLIRQAQEAEQERLRREFAELAKQSSGAVGAEPVEVVVEAARRTKRRHRLDRRRA